jgi:membrane protein required for colicin V production
MPFTLLDGVVVLVVLISAVLAMIRGFTREVFSIGSWVAAAVVAYFFWDDAIVYVQPYIEDKNIALGVTIAALFFITLLIVSIITMRISDFVLDSRAGPLDRTLGFVFGAARGLLLVIIAVLFLNFFIAGDRQPEWIAMAKTKPWLDSLGTDLMNRLPDDPEAEIMQRIRGATGTPGTPATSDDVVQEPAPEGEAPQSAPTTIPPPDDGIDLAPPDEGAAPPAEDTPIDEAPADEAPGIEPDDLNQLEQQIEAPAN